MVRAADLSGGDTTAAVGAAAVAIHGGGYGGKQWWKQRWRSGGELWWLRPSVRPSNYYDSGVDQAPAYEPAPHATAISTLRSSFQ